MRSNSRRVHIEWSDCDPAGIIFYPRYFAMFDASTTALIEAAFGMTKYRFLTHYGFSGYALVNTRAKFIQPVRFGDDVEVNSTVIEVKRSSFSIEHRITHDGQAVCEGSETRVWVGRDPGVEALGAKPIPAEVVAKLLEG